MSDEVRVSVETMTRHRLVCDLCSLQPMFWGSGYADLETAEAAAQKHREAHMAQPYCICDTVPALDWYVEDDDDEDRAEPEVGHSHCRHRGRCCECSCLTKATRPEPTPDAPPHPASRESEQAAAGAGS